jgi:hypothetical protein
VTLVHFGPVPGDPATSIMGTYENPFLGWVAYAMLAATGLYESRLWLKELRRRAA